MTTSSCAGAPRTHSTQPAEITIRLADESEVRDLFGRSPTVNPFLALSGTSRGRREIFFVLLFESGGPQELELIGASLESGTDTSSPGLLGRDELRRVWEARVVDDGSSRSGADQQRMFATIDRYALDLRGRNVLRGRSVYALVVRETSETGRAGGSLVVRYSVNGEYREARLSLLRTD